jgi:hypothetical protein
MATSTLTSRASPQTQTVTAPPASPRAPELSVLLFAPDGVKNVGAALQRIKQVLNRLGCSHEILVVGMGSQRPGEEVIEGNGVAAWAYGPPNYGAALREILTQRGFEILTHAYIGDAELILKARKRA